jgi:hypothetical protein
MGPANGERSKVRQWWIEGLALALILLVLATQGAANSGAILVAGLIFWSMGFRHRHREGTSSDDRLEGLYMWLAQQEARVTTATAPEPEQSRRPDLRLVPRPASRWRRKRAA